MHLLEVVDVERVKAGRLLEQLERLLHVTKHVTKHAARKVSACDAFLPTSHSRRRRRRRRRPNSKNIEQQMQQLQTHPGGGCGTAAHAKRAWGGWQRMVGRCLNIPLVTPDEGLDVERIFREVIHLSNAETKSSASQFSASRGRPYSNSYHAIYRSPTIVNQLMLISLARSLPWTGSRRLLRGIHRSPGGCTTGESNSCASGVALSETLDFLSQPS